MESKLSEKKTLKEWVKENLLGRPYLPLWEILLVAGTVIVFLVLALPLAKGNLLTQQWIVWFANIMMMVLIGMGLWLRGTGLSSLGLHLKFKGWKNLLKVFLWSLIVFVVTVFCFVMGEVILRGLVASGEPADMGGYAYLKDNPGLLILSLLGVYIVSSFGEELVYRGFLIHRISELFAHSRYKKCAGRSPQRTHLWARPLPVGCNGRGTDQYNGLGVGPILPAVQKKIDRFDTCPCLYGYALIARDIFWPIGFLENMDGKRLRMKICNNVPI